MWTAPELPPLSAAGVPNSPARRGLVGSEIGKGEPVDKGAVESPIDELEEDDEAELPVRVTFGGGEPGGGVVRPKGKAVVL